MNELFLSSITENTCASGDFIASAFSLIDLSKYFIVQGQLEESFHFEKATSFLEGMTKGAPSPAIIEKNIEGNIYNFNFFV